MQYPVHADFNPNTNHDVARLVTLHDLLNRLDDRLNFNFLDFEPSTLAAIRTSIENEIKWLKGNIEVLKNTGQLTKIK